MCPTNSGVLQALGSTGSTGCQVVQILGSRVLQVPGFYKFQGSTGQGSTGFSQGSTSVKVLQVPGFNKFQGSAGSRALVLGFYRFMVLQVLWFYIRALLYDSAGFRVGSMQGSTGSMVLQVLGFY